MDITDMQSLLEKLDGLVLSEGEREAFGQLLGVEEDEVEGFFDYEEIKWVKVQGFNTGKKLDGMFGPTALQECTISK